MHGLTRAPPQSDGSAQPHSAMCARAGLVVWPTRCDVAPCPAGSDANLGNGQLCLRSSGLWSSQLLSYAERLYASRRGIDRAGLRLLICNSAHPASYRLSAFIAVDLTRQLWLAETLMRCIMNEQQKYCGTTRTNVPAEVALAAANSGCRVARCTTQAHCPDQLCVP